MVKVGVIAPFSNDYPFMQRDFFAGVILGFKPSKEVEIIQVELERGVPAELTPSVRNLVLKQGAQIIICFAEISVLSEISEFLDNVEVPFILSGIGARLPLPIKKTSDYIFYNTLRLWESCWLSGKLASKLKGKQIGFCTSFFEGGYPFGYAHSLGAAINGGEISFIDIIYKNKDEDFLSLKQNIESRNVDYYYISCSGREQKSLLKYMKEINVSSDKIVNGINLMNKNTGLSYVSSWHKNSEIAGNLDFIEKSKLIDDFDCNEFSMLGYETALLINNTLSNCENEFESSDFISAMKETELNTPRGVLRVNSKTNATWSSHLAINMDASNCIQELEYPLECIDKEIETINPVNTNGWKNVYLCR